MPRSQLGNLEQEARRARYLFFGQQIAAGSCDSVATGHNLDDQAETVLIRFLRGSGTAGLAGILPNTDSGMIRPLLGLRRQEIRDWLRSSGAAWQEDCSNSETEFLRNRVRLRIMPLLLELNPSLPHTLAGTSELARGEEEYWDRHIDELALTHLIPDREAALIRTGTFVSLAPAVQRRLLRRGIQTVRSHLRGIEFHHIEAVRSLMLSTEGSGRIQLPDLDIYRSFDWLRLAPVGYDSRLERNFQTPLVTPGVTDIPERSLSVRVEPIQLELLTGTHVYNRQVNWLDWDCCAGSLVLRNWRPGDSYQPLGKSKAEKIKTLFQEQRIPLWERRSWPVITLGEEVVWARQFGAAERFAAKPDSAHVLAVRESIESKAAAQPSKYLLDMQLERAGNRQQPTSGKRSAEVL